MPKEFKFLPDVAIADIAFEAKGRTINDLFETSACALFEIMAKTSTVGKKIEKKISLENKNLENLLYDLLSEIVFLKDAEGMVFSSCKISIKSNKSIYVLNAYLDGDKINPKKQTLGADVKAITMHMFKVEKSGGFYKATVVVDI